MKFPARVLIAILLCLALSGCYVNRYGVQSTSGGTTTTVTSSQVSGSAKFSGGKIAFSSGQVPPPSAPGGHAYLGKGASALLVTGIVLGRPLQHHPGRAQAQGAARRHPDHGYVLLL